MKHKHGSMKAHKYTIACVFAPSAWPPLKKSVRKKQLFIANAGNWWVYAAKCPKKRFWIMPAPEAGPYKQPAPRKGAGFLFITYSVRYLSLLATARTQLAWAQGAAQGQEWRQDLSFRFMLTDSYLQSLGFTATLLDKKANRADFGHAWRYQFDHNARDGASLYIEHPFGIPDCRVSALPSTLAAQDVFATVALTDRPGLEAAISNFFIAHGGMGAVVVPAPAFGLRPYRRTL